MRMKQLLLVTDDVHARAWMSSALAELELKVAHCRVDEMHRLVVEGHYDVIVIDAGAALNRALHLIERLASSGSVMRLLVFVEASALPGLRMPVMMPNDFVVKGASAAEVAARVRVLVWPGEEVSEAELIRVDDLTLNLATYQAQIGGVAVDFSYLEYALFAFLVTHPGRTYSREALLQRVWGTDYFGGSRTVDVHIRRVRSKIGPELAARLETVRNVGYLWNA